VAPLIHSTITQASISIQALRATLLSEYASCRREMADPMSTALQLVRAAPADVASPRTHAGDHAPACVGWSRSLTRPCRSERMAAMGRSGARADRVLTDSYVAGLGELDQAAMTPTTDTNRPGQCQTRPDPGSTSSQAMDGAGHFGHALQAGDQLAVDHP
jgi:hypothetical protein